ncbi:Putative transposase InsK for insertion sequence element IS150 [Phycisphaerales bacterium]|nr:Putative transposase InsK for insertion sequence element IS150 [Phycisphaerales bacterium]
MPERRACRVAGQHRSVQRYRPVESGEEKRLVRDLHRLARENPRYGYRRITSLLRREGWRVNPKRVLRLWRKEGLKVPRKQRKKRRLGNSANSVVRRRPERPHHVWTYDFTEDRTVDGRRLKFLVVLDEYTRRCLALEVERGMTSRYVIGVLTRLVAEHGPPEHIRSDNGPEFIARAIRAWLAEQGTGTLFIAPGAPWENAYMESFNGKLEDELLGAELFTSLAEGKLLAAGYRRHHNHTRPHSSLGYQTPEEFAAACVPSGSAALRLRVRTREEELVTLS